jgi:hypothetical protein
MNRSQPETLWLPGTGSAAMFRHTSADEGDDSKAPSDMGLGAGETLGLRASPPFCCSRGDGWFVGCCCRPRVWSEEQVVTS